MISPYVPMSARIRCDAGGPAGMLAASIFECEGLIRPGRQTGRERNNPLPAGAYACRRTVAYWPLP